MIFAAVSVTAQCLQVRAMQHEDQTKREADLTWAETEAKSALHIYKARWGTFSLKVSQVTGLLGQIYAKMDRYYTRLLISFILFLWTL